MIANLRLVLDVEVKPGTDVAASHSSPGLWERLDRLPRPGPSLFAEIVIGVLKMS